MSRLVFRHYTHVSRTICTSIPLRTSTRVSPGFVLRTRRSSSFGYLRSGSARRPRPSATRPEVFFGDRFRFAGRVIESNPPTRRIVGLLGPCYKTGRKSGSRFVAFDGRRRSPAHGLPSPRGRGTSAGDVDVSCPVRANAGRGRLRDARRLASPRGPREKRPFLETAKAATDAVAAPTELGALVRFPREGSLATLLLDADLDSTCASSEAFWSTFDSLFKVLFTFPLRYLVLYRYRRDI